MRVRIISHRHVNMHEIQISSISYELILLIKVMMDNILPLQTLVQRGWLKLVLWRDMPIPKRGKPYAHQVMMKLLCGTKYFHL
jgi:hypothetical protein